MPDGRYQHTAKITLFCADFIFYRGTTLQSWGYVQALFRDIYHSPEILV